MYRADATEGRLHRVCARLKKLEEARRIARDAIERYEAAFNSLPRERCVLIQGAYTLARSHGRSDRGSWGRGPYKAS
eukprot:1583268-Pleurochrysis_carterae.AAC.1